MTALLAGSLIFWLLLVSVAVPALPVSWWLSSVVYGLAEAEPQLDRSRGPVMVTGLVSGCSSAAFRGLMELKWTTERQPVKPRDPSRSRSGSRSSYSEERRGKRVRSGRGSVCGGR